MQLMTERYDDLRRPFDLEGAKEAQGYPDPESRLDQPPWETAEPYEPVPAYAAEDVVDDVEQEESEPESELEPEPEAEPALVAERAPAYVPVPAPEPPPEAEAEPEPEPEAVQEPQHEPEPEPAAEHAPDDLEIPGGYRTLQGEAHGDDLAVAVVVSRFNGEIT